MSRLASREPEGIRLTARLSRSDLLWVANTSHGPAAHWHARPPAGAPDHDHLASAAETRAYLADHRVSVPSDLPDAQALAELAVVRSVVERVVAGEPEPWTADARALLADTDLAVTPTCAIASTAAGWRGFCRDLLLPLVALVAERPPLRRCSNPACRLVFEDASRNHARRWCDTMGCGNRVRVRRARVRRARGRSRPATPA